MSVLSNDEFAREVLEFSSGEPNLQPCAYYDPDGDCIEFLTSSHNFYAERIDDLVTVYYDETSNEIVGSLIKGVSAFVLKSPNLAILVKEEGRVRLAHLFAAGLFGRNKKSSKLIVHTYEKLIEQAEVTQAEAEMCLSSG